VLVIGGSAAIYGYTLYLNRGIETTKASLSELDATITTLSTDRKTVIANIIMNNTVRPSIDLKNLVSAFRLVAAKEQVRLQGFSIKNDVISTSLIATAGDPEIHPDPLSTVVRFMRSMNTIQKNFSLSPIKAVSGDISKRTTAVELQVLSSQ
jgi:hypothetical protein